MVMTGRFETDYEQYILDDYDFSKTSSYMLLFVFSCLIYAILLFVWFIYF